MQDASTGLKVNLFCADATLKSPAVSLQLLRQPVVTSDMVTARVVVMQIFSVLPVSSCKLSFRLCSNASSCSGSSQSDSSEAQTFLALMILILCAYFLNETLTFAQEDVCAFVFKPEGKELHFF